MLVKDILANGQLSELEPKPDCLVFRTAGFRWEEDADQIYDHMVRRAIHAHCKQAVLMGGSPQAFSTYSMEEDWLKRKFQAAGFSYIRIDPSGEAISLVKEQLGIELALDFSNFTEAGKLAIQTDCLYDRAFSLRMTKSRVLNERMLLEHYTLVVKVDFLKLNLKWQEPDTFLRLFKLERVLTCEQKLVAVLDPKLQNEPHGYLLARSGPVPFLLKNPLKLVHYLDPLVKLGARAVPQTFREQDKNVLRVQVVKSDKVLELGFIPGNWQVQSHPEVNSYDADLAFQSAYHRIIKVW